MMTRINGMEELRSRIKALNEEEVEIRKELFESVNEIGHHLSLKNIVENAYGELRQDPSLLTKMISAGSLLLVSYLHKRVAKAGKQSILSSIVETVAPAQITSMIRNATGEIYQWFNRKRNKPKSNEKGSEEAIAASDATH